LRKKLTFLAIRSRLLAYLAGEASRKRELAAAIKAEAVLP
jgi:hypothetical protein